MPHVPLPPSDDLPAKPLPPHFERLIADMNKVAAAATPVTGVVSKRGPVLYLVRVKMAGGTLSGMCMLQHYREFTQKEIDTMVAEAVRITNESSIGNRRKQLAAKETPITDPRQLNENLFAADVTFLEAVLSDKYEFDIVRANVVEAVIEPTIKGV